MSMLVVPVNPND